MTDYNQFMLRVAQSVAREFVDRSQADSAGAAILEMALMDWSDVRAHYPAHFDELDIIRAFARAVLTNPHTRAIVERATRQKSTSTAA
jgi:hypothetical protein